MSQELNHDEDSFGLHTAIHYNRHHDKEGTIQGRYYLNEHNLTDDGTILLDNTNNYTGTCTTTLLGTTYTFDIHQTPQLRPIPPYLAYNLDPKGTYTPPRIAKNAYEYHITNVRRELIIP